MTSPLTPIFLAPHTQKDSTMSQIPGIPASLDDVPNEQTFDAILLDYRAGIVLRSLAAYERAHRRLLADLADVDGNLAADFIEESSSLRLYLPFLINRVRDIDSSRDLYSITAGRSSSKRSTTDSSGTTRAIPPRNPAQTGCAVPRRPGHETKSRERRGNPS